MLGPSMLAWTEHYLALATPMCFIVLWLVICSLASYFSGWSALARKYRLKATFPAQQQAMQNGHLGRFRLDYSRCLRLSADEIGLYLAAMPWLRFRHPALLIPWNEITVGSGRVNLRRKVLLALGRDPQVALLISPKLAESLRQAAGSRGTVDIPRRGPRLQPRTQRWPRTG